MARETVTDFAPGLERLFAEAPAEHRDEALALSGELPLWARGTYFLNGPARFQVGGQRYRHWLDGDGMVVALRLAEGGARLTNRFVRSRKVAEEEAAGGALFRTFGTAFPGDQLLRGVALASPVNVSVYPFGGELLAFGEQGLPWSLDPRTLETREEHTFGRRLNALSPFSAHPKIVGGELTGFGVSFATGEPTLTLYRFGPGGDQRLRRRLAIQHPCSLHDFATTSRFAVFHLSPYVLDVGAMIHAGASVLDALAWRPELGAKLLVLDRVSGDEVACLPAGEGYCLHLVHAFEDGDRLIVDLLEMDEPVYPDYSVPQLFERVGPARPVRFELDLAAGRVASRREIPSSCSSDFPCVDPRLPGLAYRRFWMLSLAATGQDGRKFFDRLDAVDWEEGAVTASWTPPPGSYLAGEPALVGSPGELEQGLLLCPLVDLDSGCSRYALLDASRIGDGPVATLSLDRLLPPGFHSWFEPAARTG